MTRPLKLGGTSVCQFQEEWQQREEQVPVQMLPENSGNWLNTITLRRACSFGPGEFLNYLLECSSLFHKSSATQGSQKIYVKVMLIKEMRKQEEQRGPSHWGRCGNGPWVQGLFPGGAWSTGPELA